MNTQSLIFKTQKSLNTFCLYIRGHRILHKVKFHILYIIVCFLGIISFFSLPTESFAASLSLGLFPPSIHIETSPGNHVQQVLTITNYSDKPVDISISFKNFVSSPKENGEILFISPSIDFKNFLSDDVTLLDNQRAINQLLLSPKERRSLFLNINVQKDQKPADYYLSILFITNNRNQVNSNVSYIAQGIASNILLSINTNRSVDDGSIVSFSPPTFVNQGSLSFLAHVKNTTSHYEVVTGNITIKNTLFNTKYIIPLQSVVVLGNSSRYLRNENSTSLDRVVLSKKFLFGIYQADINVKFGNNPDTFHKTIYFSSYPVTAIIFSVISTIFIGIIFIKIIKKRG